MSILLAGFHVLCAFLSRQMAQVQFTLHSRLSLMPFKTDCLQVAIKDVVLPLLLDFLKWGQNTLAESNGSPCIATCLVLSPVVNFLYPLEQTRTCASSYPDNSALIKITIRR